MVKLYIMTLVATNIHDQTITSAASTMLATKSSHHDAHEAGLREIYARYPESEGWQGHQVQVFDVPQSFETDDHRVQWDIIPVTH